MPDTTTQTQDEWDQLNGAAVLTERLCADHVREMDEQRALFARAQQKQSPFTQAADEIEFLIQMVQVVVAKLLGRTKLASTYLT